MRARPSTSIRTSTSTSTSASTCTSTSTSTNTSTGIHFGSICYCVHLHKGTESWAKWLYYRRHLVQRPLRRFRSSMVTMVVQLVPGYDELHCTPWYVQGEGIFVHCFASGMASQSTSTEGVWKSGLEQDQNMPEGLYTAPWSRMENGFVNRIYTLSGLHAGRRGCSPPWAGNATRSLLLRRLA